MSRAQIGERCAHEAANVDAVMIVEASVFHRDERGRQIRRHVFERQPVAHQRAAMADFASVGVEKCERDRPVGGIEVLAQIEFGCEPHEDRRREVEQRDRNADDGDQHACNARESEPVADDPVAQRVQVFRESVAQHGRATSPIFAADSRL
jgi:hypothetical protein